jgi:hypothetical protein
MSISRKRAGLAAVSAMSAAILLSGAGYAADLSGPDSLKDAPDEASAMHGGNVHSTLPAGISGAAMVGQGEGMAMYMPMVMGMDGNYIGTGQVSAATLLKTINTMKSGMGANMPLRMVPESMTGQMHMLGVMYGVTDAINVMVMGGYTEKDMTMTTYNGGGTSAVGTRTYTAEGVSDATVSGLFRLYDDGINHVHLNFGMSLPTGDITKEMTMLAPSGGNMTMRATYGMQLGTGTVDLMPGLTYTGNKHFWSWGAAYRGRFALDDNNEGYHWGDSHMLTGWLGYTVYPGITATARVAGTLQDKIQGMDTNIFGRMQGANPAWYGGEVVNMFGGIEIAGHEFGLGHTRFAIEAGAPVYQNLNGPQMGQDWQVNAVAAVHF